MKSEKIKDRAPFDAKVLAVRENPVDSEEADQTSGVDVPDRSRSEKGLNEKKEDLALLIAKEVPGLGSRPGVDLENPVDSEREQQMKLAAALKGSRSTKDLIASGRAVMRVANTSVEDLADHAGIAVKDSGVIGNAAVLAEPVTENGEPAQDKGHSTSKVLAVSARTRAREVRANFHGTSALTGKENHLSNRGSIGNALHRSIVVMKKRTRWEMGLSGLTSSFQTAACVHDAKRTT